MSFDRERALVQWRRSILSNGGLTVSEVDELEDHLELLETDLVGSLPGEEAFWIAAHRIGTPDALTREFSKVRPSLGWQVKLQWALIGYLVYLVTMPIATLTLLLVSTLARSALGLDAIGLVFNQYLGVLSNLFVVGLILLATRRWAMRPDFMDGILKWLSSARWLATVALVTFMFVANYIVMFAVFRLMQPAVSTGFLEYFQSGFWFWFGDLAWYVVPAILVLEVLRIQVKVDAAALHTSARA